MFTQLNRDYSLNKIVKIVNELEVTSPASAATLVTERGSLSILKEFVEKQSALLDLQESKFIAASDEIIQALKAADRHIDSSQQEIDRLKSQTRMMLTQLEAVK